MRKTKPLPSIAELSKIVVADLAAGNLFWRETGKEVCASSRCYGGIRVRLCGQEYLLHRLLYKIAHNVEPPVVDHIDGNRGNNASDNLRAATDSINARNKAAYRNSASGHPNIQVRGRRWRVRFKIDGRTKTIGSFPTLAEAISAREQTKLALGFHANHGRSR